MERFLRFDFPSAVLPASRKHFAISLFYCQLLCAHASFSQRPLTSFNQLTDYQLGYRPNGLAVGNNQFNKTEIVVLAPEQPSLRLYEIAGNSRINYVAGLKTQTLFRSVDAVDLDGDGSSEYVALSANGSSLTVLRRTGTSAYAFEEHDVALSALAEKCAFADLNNDRRKDILLYGRTSSGVRVLLGQRDGTLKTGPTLFPDVSASHVTTADINADGVTDVLLLNWLANQLTVYYGIARLVYTEQVAVQLPDEPGELSMTSVTAERTFRVAVTIPDSCQVQVYSGNSLGDYRLTNTLQLDKQPTGVRFASLNADQTADVVAVARDGIAVYLGQNATAFTPAVFFGASRSLAAWVIADVDGDRRSDCVLLDDNARRLVVLFNSDANTKHAMEYCVGASPQGLVIGDFVGSGKFDIGVANAGSSSLSILSNEGRGRFAGQVAVPIPENPTRIVALAQAPRMEKVLIASHPGGDRVTVIDLADDVLQSKSISVPTGGEPNVLAARHNGERLQFLVRYRNARDRSYLLSSLEQINQKQFVEHSFRSTLPTKILALTVAEKVGGYELLFATNDKKMTTISQALSEPGLEFKSAKAQFSFIDSAATTQWIVSGYVNSDTLRDIIVTLGAPRNAMGIWFGKTVTTGRDSIEWVEAAQPLSDDTIIIEDVNNDRTVDIAWLDVGRRAVVVLYGADRKPFRQPVTVVQADGVSSMRIAPLRSFDELDLVLANSERGTVSVLMNPFIR